MINLVNELKRRVATVELERVKAHERLRELEAKLKEANLTMQALLIDLAMCRRENAALESALDAWKRASGKGHAYHAD